MTERKAEFVVENVQPGPECTVELRRLFDAISAKVRELTSQNTILKDDLNRTQREVAAQKAAIARILRLAGNSDVIVAYRSQVEKILKEVDKLYLYDSHPFDP